MSHFELKC